MYRVEMDDRAGLLTHAGFLALHHGPVHRGLAVRKAILCGVVPGPTNVDTESIPTGETESERSKSEKRLDHTSCGGCHLLMDPLGLPLERFGPSGMSRTEDRHGNAIATDGEVFTLDERALVGDAVEMANVLTTMTDTRTCIAKNLFTWSFGRAPGTADLCAVDRVEKKLTGAGDNLQETLVQIVADETFVMREGGQ